ncbi:MAG: hypothetical protein ACRC8M_08650 [Cetobacterium sp.]|uniref:hypothetical protein n=1 Tax=Cetobacterium sp. TaxID=2071632 RepID=UPI003F2D8F76
MRIVALFLLMTNLLFATIVIKVIEPLNFKNIKNVQLEGEKVISKGYLEITTTEVDQDNSKDYGKLLKIKFPSTLFITNKNNWIIVENISLNEEEKNGVVFKRNGQKVEIIGIIDKRKIDSLSDNVDGEYIGEIPMEIEIYENIGGLE